MFVFIKKMFTVLLTSVANASNHTKCVSLKISNAWLNLILSIYVLTIIIKADAN